MKTVYIVGIGMNSPTVRAQELIAMCDTLVGAPRLLEMFSHLGKSSHPEYKPEAVREILARAEGETAAVLVSGDVGFYSAATGLLKSLGEYDVRLAPGVPSVCEFFARLGLPWQDAALVSMHGMDGPLVSAVRRNRLTFCLTGGNTAEIGKILNEAGFGELTVHVGENLGYPDESVFTTTATELGATRAMTVLLIENVCFDASCPTGLPDTAFLRTEGVPMTKSEIRAIIMSKLQIKPCDVVYDIGAGTGSVTVEAALSAYNGHVYAIEKEPSAAETIINNCNKFHIGNVTLITGTAPGAINNNLSAPDAAFIGGSGGRIGAIVDTILNMNPNARLVTTAIALESAHSALLAYEKAGVPNTRLIQINVSRAEKRGGLNMLFAQNPIFILSGGNI